MKDKGIFILSSFNLYIVRRRFPVDFSTDLKALIRSHEANNHFDRANMIEFEPHQNGFSSANAWWLAEISRWMYLGKSMPAHKRQRPQAVLRRVGLEEQGYFTANGIHAALVSAKDQSYSVLVFRGTSQLKNWMTHANIVPFRNNAHRGYENALEVIWAELGPALENVSGKLFFTGHSMGGALAALSARRHAPSAAYTFGAPPVANRLLADEYKINSNSVPVYRLVNYRDVVITAPLGSAHLGELHYFGHDHSLRVAPAPDAVQKDQRRGPRAIMRHLNKAKWLALPERLCDHSPQNYVANLERLNLGKSSTQRMVEHIQSNTEDPRLFLLPEPQSASN